MSKSKTTPPIVKWVGLAVAIGVVGLLLAEDIITVADVILVTDTVDGRIESVDVETHRSRGRSTSGVSVEYTYAVDGVEYSGESIWPGWLANLGTSTGGGQVASRLHRGLVTVYINPNNPAQSYLIPEVNKFAIGFSLNIWGFVALLVMGNTHGRGPKLLRNAGWAIGFGFIGAGMGLLFLGPQAIPVADLDTYAWWLAGIVGGLFVLFTILGFFEVPSDKRGEVATDSK